MNGSDNAISSLKLNDSLLVGSLLPSSVILKLYSLDLNSSLSFRIIIPIHMALMRNSTVNTSHSVNLRCAQHSPGINQKFSKFVSIS